MILMDELVAYAKNFTEGVIFLQVLLTILLPLFRKSQRQPERARIAL